MEKAKDLFYNSYYNKDEDVYNIFMYNTETGKQYVKKIKHPKVPAYFVKGDAPDYYRETISLDNLVAQKVSYKWRGFDIAKILNMGDKFKRGLKEKKIKYDHIFLDRRTIGSDLFIEDLAIMDYLDSLGYEEKDGVKDYNDLPPIKNLKKGYYDIETDVLNTDIEELQPITCSTYYDDSTNTCHVFSIIRDDFKRLQEIRDNEDKFKDEFKSMLLKIIDEAQMDDKTRNLLAPRFKRIVEEMKIIISWYNTEKEMIEDSWYQMIQVYKPMYLGIFNAVYDVRHTQYRADKLGIPQHKLFCHPKVGNRFDFNYRNEDPKAAKRRHNYNSESYTKIVDVQQSYFGLRPQDQLERESLDAVSKHELGFGKLSYAHITDFIGKLPYEDYWVYMMYNMIDVIVMAFNDIKTDDISSLLTRRFIVRTEFDRVYSPMTSVTNTFFHLCKRMGYIMSNDVNKLIMTKNESAERIIERLREVDDAIESTYDVLTNRIQIAGGLCSDPNKFKKEMTPFLDDLPNNKFLNKVMDADALSMYPMIVEHTNVSKDSLDGRIEKIELNEEKEIPVEKGIQALIDKDVDIIGTAFFNLPTAKEIASYTYNIKTNKPYVREETPAYTLFLGKDEFKYAEAVRKVLGRLDNTKVDASDIKAGIVSNLSSFHIRNNVSRQVINGSLYEVTFTPDSKFPYKSLGELFTLKEDEDGYIVKIDGEYKNHIEDYIKPNRFLKKEIVSCKFIDKAIIDEVSKNPNIITTIKMDNKKIDVTARTHIFLSDEVTCTVHSDDVFVFEYDVKVPKVGNFHISIESKTLQYDTP